MDTRQTIREVLAGRRSERLPRALFGGGRWACRRTGLRMEDVERSPERFADAYADLFGGLDTDIVFVGSGMNSFPAEAIGGDLSFKPDQAPLLAHPVIEKADDARFHDNITLDHAPHSRALSEFIAHLRPLLPDRYLCATSWGPFTWAMVLCDWNHLQNRLLDRDFVREVCELGVRLSSAFFDELIRRNAVDGIVISDGAATLVPLDLYQEVILPCERKLLDRFRDRGVGRFIHQCGSIGPQVALYPETGADCVTLDAVVPLGRIYDEYQQRVVLAGNVDVIKTVFGGDAAAIRAAVADCIAGISDPLQKYILMPSCDLPPDTSLDNVRTFLSCADDISRT